MIGIVWKGILMKLFLPFLIFGKRGIRQQVPLIFFVIFMFSHPIFFTDIVATLFRVVKYYEPMDEDKKLEFMKVCLFFS